MKGKGTPQSGFSVKVENNQTTIKSRMTLSYLVAVAKYRSSTFFKHAAQVKPVIDTASFPMGEKA